MKHLKSIKFFFIISAISVTTIIGCKKNIDYQKESSVSKQGLADAKNSLFGSKDYCYPSSTARMATNNYSAARMVTQASTIYNTDFVSAGVGGTRDVGTGDITLSGLSGTVTKALLYWHGVTNSTTDVGSSIAVNSTPVTGTGIGVSSANCWPFDNSQAYVADITALVQSAGNGVYSLSGFGDLNPNGASLIVFFNDGNNTNNRDVVIFDGNDSNIAFAGITGNPNAPADAAGWDVLLSGISYTSGMANIQLHVADGQTFPDAALVVNAMQLEPAGGIFEGASVPAANNGPANNGSLWDIRTFDVTSFLSPGPNTLNLTSGLGSDCLGLIVALIDLPAGAAPRTDIPVSFDFKPQGCPNPFNVSEKGKVPAAILGTTDFDVTKVDVATVKLNGVAPIEWLAGDVASPYTGELQDCSSCTTAGPDGILDLTLKFSNSELVAALGAVTDRQCLKVNLTGNLLPEFGSTPIVGADMILILKKK